jgi:hypothetical protein
MVLAWLGDLFLEPAKKVSVRLFGDLNIFRHRYENECSRGPGFVF